MWLTLIILHATAGVAGFALGIVALQPERVRRYPWVPTAVMWLIVALLVFMIGAMASEWNTISASARVTFTALAGLGVYMLFRARRAVTNAAQRMDSGVDRYIDDVGFVLISLFNGFAIVTALDLGAPPWLVGAAAVGATVGGHLAIGQAKRGAEVASG